MENKKLINSITTLSLKGRGLYATIQYYINTDSFILNKNNLMDKCIEGNTAFESAWKELKDKGFLVQHKLKAGGKFYYEYELIDNPFKKD